MVAVEIWMLNAVVAVETWMLNAVVAVVTWKESAAVALVTWMMDALVAVVTSLVNIFAVVVMVVPASLPSVMETCRHFDYSLTSSCAAEVTALHPLSSPLLRHPLSP